MDQRAFDRLDVEGTVLCRVGDAETRDQLRDMSVRGCRISASDRTLAKGTCVDLTLLDGLTVAGTVRWSAQDAVGIEFGKKLSEAAVRYFTLGMLDGGWGADVPVDSFGRKLPPLSRIDDVL